MSNTVPPYTEQKDLPVTPEEEEAWKKLEKEQKLK